MPELSIVVTTYNRAAVVERLICELEKQTDCSFEVIVAIDGSTDGTADRLATLRPSFELRWIDTRCSGYGLALARNQGILAAEGDAAVIIDDDSVPVPGFVAAHKASVSRGVITGGPRDPADPELAPRLAWKMAELAKVPPLSPKEIGAFRAEHPNAYLIENNICLFRNDWIEMGLFSERLQMYGYIGQEFFARAEFLGYRYQYNPAAGIMHFDRFEGDNGLSRRRKTRQVFVASLLRPSLMTPRHYKAQIAMAKARTEGRPEPKMPSYSANLAFGFPLRVIGMMASRLKSALRSALSRKIKG